MLGRLLQRDTPSVPEQRAMQVLPWGDWTTSTYDNAAGVSVDPSTSLNLLAVYGCVSLIADTIATLPVDVYKRDVDGNPVEVPNKPRWLEQPNPDTDAITFWTQILSSLLLEGNAYIARSVDNAFNTNSLTVLDPTRIDVKQDQGRLVYEIDHRPFTGLLTHVRGITRPGALKGLSPVEAARQAIGLGLATQQFAGSFYGHGVNPSGVIETPDNKTVTQAQELSSAFDRDNAGLSRAHKTAVLFGGATWKQISVTAEQAQFLASRNFTASEVAGQMFLVDPTMLGISVASNSLTYANLEQRGIHLTQFTLGRWIVRLEKMLFTLLPRPQYAKFNVNALQRADMKTRFESHRIALGDGVPFETLDEVREVEDKGPMKPEDVPVPVAPTPAPAQVAP